MKHNLKKRGWVLTSSLALCGIILPLSLSLVACTSTTQQQTSYDTSDELSSHPLDESIALIDNKYGYSLAMFQSDLDTYLKQHQLSLVSVSPNQNDPVHCVDFKVKFGGEGFRGDGISTLSHVYVRPFVCQLNNGSRVAKIGLAIPKSSSQQYWTNDASQGFKQIDDFTVTDKYDNRPSESDPSILESLDFVEKHYNVNLWQWAPSLLDLTKDSFVEDEIDFLSFGSQNISDCFGDLLTTNTTYTLNN